MQIVFLKSIDRRKTEVKTHFYYSKIEGAQEIFNLEIVLWISLILVLGLCYKSGIIFLKLAVFFYILERQTYIHHKQQHLLKFFFATISRVGRFFVDIFQIIETFVEPIDKRRRLKQQQRKMWWLQRREQAAAIVHHLIQVGSFMRRMPKRAWFGLHTITRAKWNRRQQRQLFYLAWDRIVRIPRKVARESAGRIMALRQTLRSVRVRTDNAPQVSKSISLKRKQWTLRRFFPRGRQAVQPVYMPRRRSVKQQRPLWLRRWPELRQLWAHAFRHALRRLAPIGKVAVYATVILMLVLSGIEPIHEVNASTTPYDFSVPGDYTVSDAAKIEVTANQARLKSQQYATDANTAALYHFDETEGVGAETTADDVSANDNNGTFSTTSPCDSDGGSFAAGKINNDVTLSGTPNCLTVPDSASLSFSGANPSLTAEALIRFPDAFDATADTRQAILDKGNYRMYFSESDGKLKFELHGASTSKTWNKVGGSNTTNITTTEGLNGGWRQYIPGTIQVIQEYNGALYIGTAGPTTSGGTAEVWKYTSGTSWTKVAGDGVLNDQWDNINFESVQSMTVFGGQLYIGLGFSTNDGEIWTYTDSPESLVRARSFSGIEEVYSLKSDESTIYAGLGSTASDADVWSCSTTCTTSTNWTQIGGNEVNATKPNWNTGYERVRSMTILSGTLFVGLGDTAAEAEVWRYDTTTWTKVGGDGVGSTASWTAAGNYEYVSALTNDGTNLYAGLGLSASDAEVWACTANCLSGTPSWTKIGGDTANNWNLNFETVRDLQMIGTTLFASLGDTAGDAEVWRYSGAGDTWTKIAGDGVNTTWDNSFSAAGTANVKEQAFLGKFGSDLIAGTGTTPQDAEVWRCTANCTSGTPAWSWIGGRDFTSWGPAQMSQVGTMTIHNGNLYIGFGITNKHAVLWQYDGTSWTQVGGGGINGSNWEMYEFIRASTTFNGKLYVGMGDTTTDADVWEWDGATWTKMGGDGLSGSWNTNYEYVSNLVSDGTYMYAGLGASAGDAEIYKYDPAGSPNKWSKIGGDTANNWSTTREHAWQMAVYGNELFVGLGLSGTLNATPATCRAGTDGEVWRYNGTSDNWTQLGGDGLFSGWDCSATEAREGVYSMTFLEDKLYVGLGNTADEASIADGEVWECTDCTNTGGSPTWSQVGGDNFNNGWNDTDYEWVSSLISYNGDVYAGLGNEAGDAELWRYYDHDNNVGTAKVWTKVGGDGVGTPASWSTSYETINGLTVYKGRLYAGLGNTNNTTTPSDGEVWEYGGNNVVYAATAKNSWLANTWYHVAAVYNGTDLKLYVNGVQDGDTVTSGVTMADTTKTLSIGSLKGPLTSDGPYGGFSGEIDELRISSSARSPSSFVQTQYVTTPQTVQPSSALTRNQKQNWNGFDATEVANGGTLTYRLSLDGGANWKYWDTGGSVWAASSSTTQANTKAVINTNLPTLDPAPLSSGGLLWQAILTGNGDQQVIIDDASVNYIDDTQAPDNVSAVAGNDGNWFNRANPSFTWSAPADNADTGNGEVASNVEGYYVYFGTNASAVPRTDGAAVFTTNTSYTASAISGADEQPYYLRIQTRDNAQNTSSDGSIYDQFRDTKAPNNVTSVTGNANSGNWFNRANPVFNWTAPTDDLPTPNTNNEVASGVKGYYVYFGTNANAVPRTDGTFVTGTTYTASPIDPSDTQIYYFRIQAKDKALNTTSDVSGIYDAFSDTTAPNNVTSVTGNSGAWFNRANPQFSWSAPTDVAGGGGEKASGIAGYYVYFGTDPAAVPRTAGTFVTGTSYAGTPINQADNQPYYFRIQTRDANFNTTSDSTGIYDAFRDTVAPANVTTVTGNNGNWFDRANPQFSWSAPTDSAGGGEQVSGINGYFVYFGTNPSAVPRTAGTLVTGTTYSGTPISPSDTQQYFFRIQTRDNAMNVTADIGGILNGFNDATPPNNVTSVTGNSGNWFDRANPQFSWSAATDGTPGGGEVASGINGYFVYFGTNAAAVPSVAGTLITGTTYSPTPISGADLQTYYFRIQTRDNAMNLSGVYDQFRDTNAPNNVASVTALSANAGTPITTNTWYNYATPEFSWSAPTDDLPVPNTNTEVASGIGGYYVYFGTTFNANPAVSGTFQTGTTFTPSSLVSGQTYYLRIQARDKALNGSSAVLDAFTYKFDNVGPSGPTVSASPAGYTAVNNFTFFWLNSGAGGPVDPGAPTNGSGLPSPATFIYRVGTQAWSTVTTDTQVTIPSAAYQEGANVFEIKAIDNVGNEGTASSVTFYYSGSAPTPPENLTVSPTSTSTTPSTANSFSFAWDPPLTSISPIKQYRFSVNKTPTANNTTITPFRSLSAAPYATQQGKNTFYVVAEDEAGNLNYDNPAEVNFYTLTPAPAPPTSLQIFDISNRDTAEYAISMKWTEPSKTNGFDGYEVYRSEDNVTFVSAGTTKSPVFIDTNLTSKPYYYKVRSKDNAGQTSIDSTTVTITPTGRFTTPPKIIGVPTVTTKSFSAVITWTTDRNGSSFIEFGPDPYHLGKQAGGETIGTLDLVSQHTVDLKGLNPETTYSYQAVWVDQDGNRGQSDILSMTTGLRPKISDVTIKDITLTGASISWTSTTVSTSTINYGKTKAFGQSIADTSGGGTTKHTLRIEDLSDTSTYYFVITGKDLDDNLLSSDEYSFTTLTRPIISDFKYETVKDAPTTSIHFTWKTNVPTTTIVFVGKQGTVPKSQSDSEYGTEHQMTVSGLADLTAYSLQAKGVDNYGNAATSANESFTTPDDSRPPKILNMTVEVRSSGAGAVQKAQLVINWETDEPGSSQVEYGPGISSDTYPSRTQEDPALTTTHVVIVPELEPAKLYHLRAVSRDRASNAGTSADTTSITGKVQKSVVDIIINSLTRSLGFLSAIPGLGK